MKTLLGQIALTCGLIIGVSLTVAPSTALATGWITYGGTLTSVTVFPDSTGQSGVVQITLSGNGGACSTVNITQATMGSLNYAMALTLLSQARMTGWAPQIYDNTSPGTTISCSNPGFVGD